MGRKLCVSGDTNNVTQARDRHPFLSRFEQDWATEEIVKQYVKNKRKNHYAHGWLEVPEKYTYLKQNSSKRDPGGSRSKKALMGVPVAKKRGQKRQVAGMEVPRLGIAEGEVDLLSDGERVLHE